MRDKDLLAAIVQRVDSGKIARRMVDVFREEIAAYRRLPAAAVEGEIVAISRENVELFFRSLVEDRSLTDEELEPFRESARHRAAEGLSLEDLLHAYRLGGRFGWQALIECAEPGEQAALLPSVARLMEYVDRVSDAVTETYHEWSRHLASEEERTVRELLDAITSGGPLDSATLELAERQSVPVAEQYAPFALALGDAAAHEHARWAADLRGQGLLAVNEGEKVVGLLSGPEAEPMLGIDHRGAVYAIGEVCPRDELRDALAEVRAVVELGGRLGKAGRVEVERHLPELLLSAAPRIARRIRAQALGPLEEYAERRRADLLETVRTFIACDLDRRRAAKRLHVHPNTLDYRLRRVEELTGLRLAATADLALIYLALLQPSTAV
jgi:hypothetical protein